MSRAIGHSRVQWTGLQGSYISNFISFDTYSSKYNSGFGTYLTHDNQGEGIITSTKLALTYSYQLALSSSWSMRFGANASFFTKTINDEGLIYPNQITPGGIVSSQSHFGNASFSGLDLGTGAMLYNSSLWIGFMLDHINKPSQSFENFELKLPIKYAFMAGYKIPLKRKLTKVDLPKNDEYNLFPIFHYKFQGKSDQVETGLIYVDNKFKAGMIYRGIPFKQYNKSLQNNEAIVLLMGMRLKYFKLTYSYDIITSKLTINGPSGAHELNISYIFHDTPKKPFKPSRRLPCPHFK